MNMFDSHLEKQIYKINHISHLNRLNYFYLLIVRFFIVIIHVICLLYNCMVCINIVKNCKIDAV